LLLYSNAAVVFCDKGAILKLIFGGDKYNAKLNDWDDDKWVTPEPATLEVGMTEADFSNKHLGVGGAIIISAWISQKDNRALTKFNISKCELMAEGGKALAAGLKGNQVITELNISNNDLLCWKSCENADTSGIIAIADAIPDMRALTSLNLASNIFGVEGAKIIAAVLPGCT
jgi:hypothetical protein